MVISVWKRLQFRGLLFLIIVGLGANQNIHAQWDMLKMDTAISFSADTSKGVLYGYNNRTLELFSIKDGHVQVLDTILFRYNMDYSVFYEQQKNNLPREAKMMHFYYDPISREKHLLFWDAGLGRVHTYDFNHQKLHQLDASYDMRSFFGHGSWVNNETLDIYAMGGYGEFVHKHNFLKFDQAFQEWTEIQTFGNGPKDELFGQLYFDENRNRYLFIQRIWDLKLIVYELTANTYKWNLLNSYEFDNDIRDADYNSYALTGNYTFLGEEWLSLHANLILHLPSNKLYRVQNPNIQQKINKTLGMFPATNGDSVMVFGDLNHMDKQLGVIVIPVQDVLGYIKAVTPNQTIMKWWIIIIISGLLAGVLLYRRRRSPTKLKPIHFNATNTSVVIRCKRKNILFDEAVDLRFWHLAHELIQQKVSSISFSDFDQAVFDEHYQPNQYSIKRSQLIEHINRKLGTSFVQTRKEQHDKRFKRIVFNFNALDS